MRFCSPPKVKKQSKQKRQSGLDKEDTEVEKDKGECESKGERKFELEPST